MNPEHRTRVTVAEDGPLLIAGPVRIEMPDGTVVRSDRTVTALCVCRRSRRAPFCDTSHRRRTAPTSPACGPATVDAPLAGYAG